MNPIVGLDIGTTKVCCLVAHWDTDHQLHLVGYGVCPSKGLRQGQVIDLEQTISAIHSAVHSAQQMADVPITRAFVGVTGSHIESIPTTARVSITRPDHEVTEEDLERLRQQLRQVHLPPDRELLHVLIRQYILDGQPGVLNPLGMSASHLEANATLITGGLTFLQNIRRCVDRAGLEVQALVLEPYASGLSVLSAEEREVGVALIDIGGGTTDVAIFHGNTLVHTGVIPLGGNHVSQDIYLMFRIASPEEAERVKREHGCALAERVHDDERVSYVEMGTRQERVIPRRLFTEVIEERMRELLEMAHEELHRSGMYHRLSAGAVLTGGGACLPCTAELGRLVFQNLPVRIGVPNPPFKGLPSELTQPAFATAIGLVIYGAEAMPPYSMEENRFKSLWNRLMHQLQRLIRHKSHQ